MVPEDSEVVECSFLGTRCLESDEVEGKSLSVDGGSALRDSVEDVGGSVKIEGWFPSEDDLPLLERELEVTESEGFKSSMSTSASLSSLMLFPGCPCPGPMSMSGGTSSMGIRGTLVSSSESTNEKE